jgi:hypothetical protein
MPCNSIMANKDRRSLRKRLHSYRYRNIVMTVNEIGQKRTIARIIDHGNIARLDIHSKRPVPIRAKDGNLVPSPTQFFAQVPRMRLGPRNTTQKQVGYQYFSSFHSMIVRVTKALSKANLHSEILTQDRSNVGWVSAWLSSLVLKQISKNSYESPMTLCTSPKPPGKTALVPR